MGLPKFYNHQISEFLHLALSLILLVLPILIYQPSPVSPSILDVVVQFLFLVSLPKVLGVGDETGYNVFFYIQFSLYSLTVS